MMPVAFVYNEVDVFYVASYDNRKKSKREILFSHFVNTFLLLAWPGFSLSICTVLKRFFFFSTPLSGKRN
ncbi:hypothetical protein TRIATDRAFT_142486, partial [Trichoderma atroviride IMI 206040]